MHKVKLCKGFGRDDFPEAKDVHVKKGELLLYEGESHRGNCFVILEGKLDVRLITSSGHETLLYYLYPGELVGELAMFGVDVRTATIMASEKSCLLEISNREFTKCIKDYDFLQKITRLFIDRYIRTHEVVCRLGQPNIAMKLCRYFKSLSAQYNTDQEVITLRLPSHAEMGKLLSCQRETVTREVKKLVFAGIVVPCDEGLYFLNRRKMNLFLVDMLD